jgi:serine protease
VLAEQLSGQPEVEYAEPNYVRKTAPMPERAERSLTSGFHTALVPSDPDYAAMQWNFPAINMPGAWTINPGGDPNLTVAIVDTGITSAKQTLTFPLWTGSSFQNVPLRFDVSPDLSVARIVSPHDFVFSAPGGAVVDMDGHATHVGSTVAENTNDSVALAGMAFRVKLMPVKVCLSYWELMIEQAQAGTPGFLPSDAGGCPDDAIAAGIRYAADNGARAINLSLGGTDPSLTIRDAMQYAVTHGAFVGVAMGNGFEDGNPTEYPAAYAPELDGVMSVAAVGRSLKRAYYSSTGSYTEIAAPGGDFRDQGSQGLIYQVTLSDAAIAQQAIVPRFDVYLEDGYQGTSMAAPHVTATAALVMSQIGSAATPAAVEAIIRATARPCDPASCDPSASGTRGRNNNFGYGLIQPRTALFGVGLVK